MKSLNPTYYLSKLFKAIFLATLIQCSLPLQIVKAYTLKEYMNQTALLLSSSSTISALNSLGYIPDNSTIDLVGNFSEDTFNSTSSGIINSNPFILNYTGNLSGDVNNNITISMSAVGNLGDRSISTTSTLIYDYDLINNRYNMKYQEIGSTNPIWFIVIVLVGYTVLGTQAIGDAEIQSPPPPPPPPPKKIGGGRVSIEIPDTTPISFTCAAINSSVITKSCKGSGNQIKGTLSVRTPEPSFILGFLGLSILGAGAILKRKLKTTYTGKETVKIS